MLNPIAGEKMQQELEQRISALQSELERAHSEVRLLPPPSAYTTPAHACHDACHGADTGVDLSQVHVSEERLESTIEELTRLEMAAHGFHAALSHKVKQPLHSAPPAAHSNSSTTSSSSEIVEEAQQSSSAAHTAGGGAFAPTSAAEASEPTHRPTSGRTTTLQESLQRQEHGEQQRQHSGPPERQRQR